MTAEGHCNIVWGGDFKDTLRFQTSNASFSFDATFRFADYTRRNLSKAEENLRMARVGFDEGVITTSDLLAAQTAWMAAKTDVVDAQIDLQLANAALQKAISN